MLFVYLFLTFVDWLFSWLLFFLSKTYALLASVAVCRFHDETNFLPVFLFRGSLSIVRFGFDSRIYLTQPKKKKVNVIIFKDNWICRHFKTLYLQQQTNPKNKKKMLPAMVRLLCSNVLNYFRINRNKLLNSLNSQSVMEYFHISSSKIISRNLFKAIPFRWLTWNWTEHIVVQFWCRDTMITK